MLSNSRALVVMSTEEQTLSAMVANALDGDTLGVGALLIATEDARLKVLLEPGWMRQRQIGKGSFAFDKVPRRSHIVEPADDTLDGISHNIQIDGSGQIELGEVGEAHMLDEHRRFWQLTNDLGHFLLLILSQTDGLHLLHSITMELKVVALGQTSQQLHECLAAHLGNAIEEDQLHLSLACVVQIAHIQR